MIPAVAMASPLVPPSANPRFQPKYIPEMTYPTPSPHNIKGPRVRDSCGEEDVSFGLLIDILKDNKISIDRPIETHLQINYKLLRSDQHLQLMTFRIEKLQPLADALQRNIP